MDILKSGTRRDDLLLTAEEAEAVDIIRKATNTLKPEESVEKDPGIVCENEKQLGICGICEENEILLKNSLQTGGFCDILTKLFIGVR